VFPLLRTKLNIPPSHPSTVPRPRLTERINLGLDRKLTLISAPAGYGKTTLLVEWAKHQQKTVAWLSLDGQDNDPWRFLTYVIYSLQTIDESLGIEALTKVQAGRLPSIEMILCDLINQISISSIEIIFILDDYHVIHDQQVHNILEVFLNNLPQQIHLVISSRIDPPLPLARLRIRDQLIELRVADLRFSLEEVAAFFQGVFHLSLSDQEIITLEQRTEGWIAVLQAAALSMQNEHDNATFIANFTGSSTHIFDLLVEEVFHRQPDRIQSFMLQTSILQEFNGSLVNAVTCLEDGSEVIRELSRLNLFIVELDQEGQWFRYHQLLSEFLRRQIKRLHPQLISDLYERASVWCEQNEMLSQAVTYSLASSNHERTANLIEMAAEESFISFPSLDRLTKWIDHLPGTVIQHHPRLIIAQAWKSLADFDFILMENRLLATDRALAAHHADLARLEAVIRGEINAIRAVAARLNQNLDGCIHFGQDALGLIPEDQLNLRAIVNVNLGIAHLWIGNTDTALSAFHQARSLSRACEDHYIFAYATNGFAEIYRLRGDLKSAERIYRESLEIWQEIGSKLPQSLGLIYIGWGEILFEWNDLETATEYLIKGISMAKQEGDELTMAIGCIQMACLKLSQGDAKQTIAYLEEVKKVAHRKGLMGGYFVSQLTPDKLLQFAQLSEILGQDYFGSVDQRFADDILVDLVTRISYVDEVRIIAWARMQIAAGETKKALFVLEDVLPKAAQAERISSLIDILLLKSKAFYKQNQIRDAIHCFRQALEFAEPGRFIRKFFNMGNEIGYLLNQIAVSGKHFEYIHVLRKAYERNRSQGSFEELIQGQLTDRELEVLRLVAMGLSNREIAETLVIALTTTKKHVSNIIGKLAVRNRTEAVTRALDLNLL
jgi:LuxR family maltose regulon positive regulatory protein